MLATTKAPSAAEDEQLPLLPLPFDSKDAARQSEKTGKPGRPAGSLNRRTEDFANYILTNFTSPLIGMAQTYSRPVEELAKDLGCDLLEAHKLQLDCMKALAPYVHQKMPVAVQGVGDAMPMLVVVAPEVGAQLGVLDGDVIPVPTPLDEDQEPEKT